MAPPVDHEVDVLIIGAGPAGSSAARVAAELGLDVLIVDRRKKIGRPIRCAEYVPMGIKREVPEGVFEVEQAVDRLCLHLPNGESRQVNSAGAVIDRATFDSNLANAASDAGATLWSGCPALDLDRRGTVTLGGERTGTRARGRLVIGADGPRSRVAIAAGLGRPRVMIGLQRVVPLAAPMPQAHLYFWSDCRYGYGWLFPKGDSANLGVALPRGDGQRARRSLADLSRKLMTSGVIGQDETERLGAGDPGRSGLVPCSGPLPRLAAGRVLLVGDAAGQTDALSGAGIVAAVRGGTLAGEAAADALKKGKWRQAAPRYEQRWRETFGRNAARGLNRRFELEALWDRDVQRAVARAWLPE